MCFFGPGADHLGEEGDADAHQLAALALLGLLPAELVVAGDPHRLAHGLLVVAGVVGPAGLVLVGELLGLDEALHPQLGGVDVHLERELADEALDQEDGLGDPERAAVGDAAGRLVRVDGLDAAVRRLEVVGAGEHVEEPRGELRGLRRAVEGAVVGDHVDLRARDPPVLGADPAAHDVVAREAGGHQVLRAVLDPLDGLAGDDRADDRADVAGIDGHLVPEAAPDVVGHDPDHLLGQAGDLRVDGPVQVRRLVAVVDVELTRLRVHVGDHPAGLERRRMAARVDHVPLDDHVRLREDALALLGVAGLPEGRSQVVGLVRLVVPDHRRVRVERLAGVDDRGQRVVLDVDQGQRVTRRVAVLGDHERDLLALEADLVAGQHGLRVVGERRHPGEAERLEVLGGDHPVHLRVRERAGGVDRDDPRVRVRAAQHGAVEHPGKDDVVEVLPLPPDEARVLLALHVAVADRRFLRSDGRHVHLLASADSCSAAQRTALTMLA